MTDIAQARPRRVLVIGAAGAFGERLVLGLLRTTSLDVVAAGRDQARLSDLVARLGGTEPGWRERIAVAVMDVQAVTSAALKGTGAFAVVDAAGPYQDSGYRLAQAAIGAGLHYIDLADSRSFVAGIGILDGAARAAGVSVLTGASSTPALSNATLDRVTAGWTGVDRVEVAISPGNRAPRGLSVVRSILSYAGKPVRVLVDGRWGVRPGWGVLVRRRMPGVGRRWLSLVETPDLDIVAERFRVRRTAVFRAGLELPVLHLGLLLATLPVRAGLIRSLLPLARPFRALAGLLAPFGTDRGGMLVVAEGLDADGQPVRGTWWLVAEGGDGPFVPTLPALAVLRAQAAGSLDCGRPDRYRSGREAPVQKGLEAVQPDDSQGGTTLEPGASACVGVLTLEQIEAEFAGHRITSGMRFERPGASLYERLLGAEFDRLPAPLRDLHRPGWGQVFHGVAQVDGADGVLARLAARAFGLPRRACDVPVQVRIAPAGGGERWQREFDGRGFASTLSASPVPGRLVERFGPFSFEMELQAGQEGITGMPVRAWKFGPLPMPRVLAPVSLAREGVDDQERFRFDVEMRLPLGLGRLVRYRGWLAPGSRAGCAARFWLRGR